MAVVRGYPRPAVAETPGAAVLVRDAASDMFSLGTAEARAAGLRDAARLPDGDQSAPPDHAAPAGVGVDLAAVERAMTTVAGLTAAGTQITPAAVRPGTGAIAALDVACDGTSATAYMRLGADVHRLRSALAAEGVRSVAVPHDDGIHLDLFGS